MKVAILFGGKSPEHDVSIMSAQNVFEAVDKTLFQVNLIYQNRQGIFFKVSNFKNLNGEKFDLQNFKKYDVVFPVMHGPNSEDGKLQGFLETLGVKWVGCGVLSSALCMDKDIQKQIARFNGIKVTNWISIKRYEFETNENYYSKEIEKLKFPVFVKPSNMGSSVGITKVKSKEDLSKAISEAFKYDEKIIIEKMVTGRELEVAVLGKDNELIISLPGEVVSLGSHEFYDYDAKYFDQNGSKTFIQAKNLNDSTIEETRELSKKIFKIFECIGLSRIDYFLTNKNQIILNEINTMPGFTNISMYPKLIENSGLSYKDLISKLILLAK